MRQRQTRYEKRVKRNEIVRDRQTTYALASTDCNDVAYAQRGSELMRAGCLIEPQRLVHRHGDAVSFFGFRPVRRARSPYFASLGGGAVCVGWPAGGGTL